MQLAVQSMIAASLPSSNLIIVEMQTKIALVLLGYQQHSCCSQGSQEQHHAVGRLLIVADAQQMVQ